MARKSRSMIMNEYDAACAVAIAQISDKMGWMVSDADRTVESAFGSLTLIAMRWQPASIGGTWGTYRSTTGDTRGGVVSASEIYRLAEKCGVEYPRYPR